ncbi:hypothetical protein KY290_027878 [Solanum tuberosum]|uniref:Uncharacterized protein n=1 Tax=Solanum tuberosum TaxID=4113 RepID=A0ABQ7UGA8_SOLTU|nr:hypothetical protein KY290_027878 [Solanum tuberosum]
MGSPPRGLKEISSPSIDKDGNRASTDAGHDGVEILGGNLKYLRINFEDHVGHLAFHLAKVGDVFLENDGIVRGSSI